MKSVSSRMAAVALTMWLGFGAGTANAGALVFGGWDFSVPFTASTSFGNSLPGTTGTTNWSDWLDFSLPYGAQGTAISTVMRLVPATMGGHITQFDLYKNTTGGTGGTFVTSGATGSGVLLSELSFSGGAVPGIYELRVGVSNSHGYSGTIITPVPEPETYAMLLAGLGLIGFTARRRKQNA